MSPRRKQCKNCPWKVGSDPHKIPNYEPDQHEALKDTIAEPGSISGLNDPLRIFTCHDSPEEKPLPCVGWLLNQLGPGNNLALRIAVRNGRIDAHVETVGPQHACLEDTLPKKRR